jgi:peptide/nickel transport system permease protein
VSSLLVSASFARDLPVMQATVIAIFAIFIVISIMIDIAQSVVDPRIQENPL